MVIKIFSLMLVILIGMILYKNVYLNMDSNENVSVVCQSESFFSYFLKK